MFNLATSLIITLFSSI